MPTDFRQLYLDDIRRTYRNYKTLGERAMAQVSDENLHTQLDADANSIAIVVKHLAGNLRSRFTDFLTSDGEKPDRNRDSEFEMPERASREEMIGWWDSSWSIAFASIDGLTPDDVTKTTYIRGEGLLVVESLNRLASHAAYHVGQIVFLAKHFAGPRWTSLSIPKGRSADVGKATFKQGIIPNTPPRSS